VGPRRIRIGDSDRRTAPVAEHFFAPPTLETVVVPPPGRRPAGALHTALTQLAEQDPLINLRQDEVRQEISVSLYGEVQKEVIQATLADEFGLDVGFRETTTICIERPVGSGRGGRVQQEGPEPVPRHGRPARRPGAGRLRRAVRLEVELGAMPYAFFKAVEDTVRETLARGCTAGGSPTARSP
jgi:ribosomal protection tetracycline resistance protein